MAQCNEESQVRSPIGAKKEYIRSRSSLACQECRRRKVRCDMNRGGAPCTNCRLDRIQCKPGPRRRRRKSLTLEATFSADFDSGDLGRSQKTLPTSAVNYILIPSNLQDQQDENEDEGTNVCSELSPSHMSGTGIEKVDPNSTMDAYFETDTSSFGTGRPVSRSSMSKLWLQPAPLASISPSCDEDDSLLSRSPHTLLQLPTCLLPVVPEFDTAVLRYLEVVGAFSIPKKEMICSIVESYVEVVYPMAPMINLSETLLPVLADSSDNSVSLMLFQSILLLGTTYVDDHVLDSTEFTSKREALQKLYKRVKTLWDVEYEQDPIVLCQVALHMALYRSSDDPLRPPSLWLAQAIRIACLNGWHCLEDPSQEIKSDSWKLRKRLWWSCVVQDHLLSFELGRIPTTRSFNDKRFQLKLDDIHLKVSYRDALLPLLPCAIIQDEIASRRVGEIFLSFTKLCSSIADILLMTNVSTGGSQPVPIGLEARTLSGILVDFDIILRQEQNLEGVVVEGLPLSTHSSRKSKQTGSYHRMISIQEAILQGIVSSLIVLLHRTLISKIRTNSPLRTQLQRYSTGRILKSVKKISQSVQQLLDEDFCQYLPPVSVKIVTEAIAALLQDRSTHRPKAAEEESNLLEILAEALKRLKHIYPCADAALNLTLEAQKIIANDANTKVGPNTLKDMSWETEQQQSSFSHNSDVKIDAETQIRQALESPDLNGSDELLPASLLEYEALREDSDLSSPCLDMPSSGKQSQDEGPAEAHCTVKDDLFLMIWDCGDNLEN